MSLLNQPSTLFISSDDLEWGSGQNYNITLPESMQGGTGVACSRAVIPNTLYPIPSYMNTFCYEIGGVEFQLPITTERNYTSVPDLVAQLNIDAIDAGQDVVFQWNTSTERVSVVLGTNTAKASIIAGVNDQLVMNSDAGPNPEALITIPEGNYTLAQFATVLQTAMQPFITSNDVPHVGPGATIAVSVVGGNTLKFDLNKYAQYPLISFNFKGIPVPGLPTANDANRAALTTIMGFPWNATPNQGTYFIFVSNSLSSITAPNPAALSVPTAAVSNRALFPPSLGDDLKYRFAVNTRLGFPYVGITGTSGVAITGTFLPNLLRTKVVYILCNIAVNDTISTDGLRTCIAKVPMNASYGGYAIFSPADVNFSRIVNQTYQNVNIQLIDENYMPYPLNIEEITEIELSMKYREQ
jgi:hypothetical protein